MLDRLNPFAVVRGHWKGMRDRTRTGSTADIPTRTVVLAVPATVGVIAYFSGAQVVEPGLLLSALALLSAGLLAAFAQSARLRAKYERPDDDHDPERLTRQMLDESVAHMLWAALVSALVAVIIVVGINVAEKPSHLGVGFSAVVSAGGTYLFLLFVMTARKLYGAYVVANDVERDLSGHH